MSALSPLYPKTDIASQTAIWKSAIGDGGPSRRVNFTESIGWVPRPKTRYECSTFGRGTSPHGKASEGGA